MSSFSKKFVFLILILFLVFLSLGLAWRPVILQTGGTTPAQGPPFVTQEIRYHMPEASEVFLVWGINGWNVVPDEIRPAGTVLKDALMYTPMDGKGDTFVVKVQVPPGATIEYGFMITKKRSGAAIKVWQASGEENRIVATQDGVIEVQASPSVLKQIAGGDSDIELPWPGLLLLTGVCVVLASIAVWMWVVRPQVRPQKHRFETLLYRRRLIYLWDLLRELVARDMKVRYKRSVLGIAWSLVTPLLQLLVFYVLFRLILSFKIGRYSSFTLSGLLVWSWFQSSLSQAANAITGNRELIRRPAFPAVILPVVTVITNLIHFLLAFPILLVVLVVDGTELRPTILALPLVVILQFVLTLSLAYLAASANVIFADTQHLIGVLLQLLFFLTPIFYDTSAIPARYYSLYRLNPMVRLLEAYRAVLIGGMQPDWLSLLVPCLFAVGLLCVGYKIFTQVSYRFVEEL